MSSINSSVYHNKLQNLEVLALDEDMLVRDLPQHSEHAGPSLNASTDEVGEQRFLCSEAKGSRAYYMELAQSIKTDLFNNKAENLEIFDTESQNKGSFFNIIAQGNSNRHASALASKLLYRLKHFYRLKSLVSGIEQGHWVLLDLGGVVVHIFTPEAYTYYDLVELWRNFENYKSI